MTSIKASYALNNIVYGGKNFYGAAVGILMLETKFPRVCGDIGNGVTWPFPVLMRVYVEPPWTW
ncbi:hypothetical protein [Desulfobacula sp.]|jgi:hypothetical protein|uniref:hypothetical protein n=1 Tax=Desulfobacula sp. TaxID=2593537 RepID=UPI0039B99C9F